MFRLEVINGFPLCRSDENKKVSTEQRSFCVKRIRRGKAHYKNLNIQDLKGNKGKWKIVQSFSEEKITNFENITLVKNNVAISFDTRIAETLSSYFSNIIKDLDVIVTQILQNDFSNFENPAKMAIKKQKNHTSIEKIKGTFGGKKIYSLELISLDIIFKKIAALYFNKAIHSTDVSYKTYTELVELYLSEVNRNTSFLDFSSFFWNQLTLNQFI